MSTVDYRRDLPPRHRPLRTSATTLLAAVLLAGCAQPDAIDPQSQQAPLLGDTKISDPNCGDRRKQQHMRYAHRLGKFAAASRGFAACVERTMRTGFQGGPYLECNGDPFHGDTLDTQIARVIDVARSPNDMQVSCIKASDTSRALAWTGQNDGYMHSNDERYTWGKWFHSSFDLVGEPLCTPALQAAGTPCAHQAFPWPYAGLAGIIWHEAMHTHGYGHGHNNDNAKAAKACGHQGDPTFHFQSDTVPYLVGSCITWVLEESQTTCTGGLETFACGDSGLQMVQAPGGTCECVRDPSIDDGFALLMPQVAGTHGSDSPLVIEDNVWANNDTLVFDARPLGGGDFDGDGKHDVLVGESYGQINVLSHNDRGEIHTIDELSGRVDSWTLSDRDRVVAIGDFNGLGHDSLVLRNDTHLGHIGNWGGSWFSWFRRSFGSDLGNGWTLRTSDEVVGSGDFAGTHTQRELLLQAADGALGFARLEVGVGGGFRVYERRANGDRIGQWRVGTNDRVVGTGDFNADGRTDIVIRSAWGLGVLGRDANGQLTDLAMKPWRNRTSDGNWMLWDSDRIEGVGDFNGDGRSAILIRDSHRLAVMQLAHGGLRVLAEASHGDRLGQWWLNDTDRVAGIADLYGQGRDNFVLRSDWGMGIAYQQGRDLQVRWMRPHGRLFGEWQLRKSDRLLHTVGAGSGSQQGILISR